MSVKDRLVPERTAPDDLLFATLKVMTLTFFFSIIILPFLYAFIVSLLPSTEVYAGPHWIPQEPTVEWWADILTSNWDNLWNSFVVASGTAILALLITIPSSYAFARTEFPGRREVFYLIIIALLFPYLVLVIPITDIWNDLGLFNTVVGMWIAYQIFVAPFAIWILRDFFENLPSHLEEAAQVYGHTQFSAFLHVILPVAAPAVIAVGFLAFLTGWNDFLFSNLLTNPNGPQPAVVRVFNDTSNNRTLWAPIMARVLIIGTPPTLLYLASRRYLSEAFAVND